MSERLSQLSREERRQVLARLQNRRQEESAAAPPRQAAIPRRTDDGPQPLSFAQQRLWFLAQLDPASSAYNIHRALRLTGPLDVGAFARSLREIVRRHEVLRTRFATRAGQPVQIVDPPPTTSLPMIDLSALAEPARGAEARRLCLAAVRLPFDLDRAPLRTLLVALGPAEWIAVFVLHHIVCDEWSIGLFVRELTSLYQGFLAGRPAALPELPIQYADFARWQRDQLQGAVLAEQLDWWKSHLGTPLPVLELPADRPRPALRTSHGGHRPLVLSAADAEALRAVGRGRGATVFMTLCAALQTLLGRWSGQDQVLLGSPVTYRNRVEVEPLLGFFVNALVLRGDLAGDPPFLELLDRSREASLGAYAHQDLPFERLVEALQPERDLSRPPLFQVILVYQGGAHGSPRGGALDLPGLALSGVPLESGTARIDLGFEIADHPEGLFGEVEFSADLFEPATVERLVGHFTTLLRGIAADPGRRLSELPLLGPAERHQLLVEWNDAGPAVGGTVHEVFAAQARSRPGDAALVVRDTVVTYGELADRAGRLARRLRAAGVGPERPVGLLAERSPEAIAGILGILAAGGCYVPLDPDYPAERLELMAREADVAAVVAQQRFVAALAALDRPVIDLSSPDLDPGTPDDSALPAADPEHPVYVIYTSGSLGRPKGVVVRHGALANFARAVAAVGALGPGGRMLLFAPLAFDASALQIFPPLIAGAALVLEPQPGRLAPREIVDLCERQGVTVLDFPVSVWRQWIEELTDGSILPRVRACFTGGESLTAEKLRSWGRLTASPVLLLSSYGPTEATVTTTLFTIHSDAAEGFGASKLPLGRPLPGTRVLLLDRHRRPVPTGVPGEIYIAGAGTARGYLGRPELTAEAFVPVPEAALPGERLYRTGDLARRLPDGALDFLGRADHQVKIRGFRVEPGEIETLLSGHPALREAVVVAPQEAGGSRRLVAYVLPEPGQAPSVSELRAFLGRSLPEFMVPTAFITLEAVPLLPSGKIDRRALPAPESARFELSAGFVAPRTPLEQVLAGIWAEVLTVERVGAFDNFFELGGHSLIATQVTSRLHKSLGIELPLRRIFESPTVAGVAAAILDDPHLRERAERGVETSPRPGIPRRPTSEPAPLSFGQQRLWFLHQMDPSGLVFNLPEGIRLAGSLDVPALAAAFAELVRRHETLRTAFAAAVGGEPVQIVGAALDLPLPCADLSGLPAARRLGEATRQGVLLTARPFDLGRGFLLRRALLRLAPDDHALLLVAHHIVSDGWSLGVLVRELTALYAAFAAGRPSPLTELPIQYADFAVWQRERFQGEVLESNLRFWREHLAGAPASLTLPSDRPRPAVQSSRGSLAPIALDAATTAALWELARGRDGSLFMVLLAAFGLLLQRTTGAEDLIVGTPVAGRGRWELEGLIGFFINTLPLRLDLTGDPPFGGLLARVREVVLAADAHQELPFERLLSALEVARDLSQTPLFQAVLAFQSFGAQRSQTAPAAPIAPIAPIAPTGAGKTGVTPFAVDSRAAQYDLHLVLNEGPQGISGALGYRTDLFEAATAGRLARCFLTLLHGIAAGSGHPVSELPLLTPAERHQLATDWNRFDLRFEQAPLHELFAAAAARAPEATAVCGEGRYLTYGQLAAQAGRLARRLRRLGIGTESRVGLCLERSPEMVVAVVAILQTGGAYVPLDPDVPAERLAYLLQDSGVGVVVTNPGLAGRLPDVPGLRHLLLDDPSEVAGPDEGPCAATLCDPEQAAYVIYTSGSTGRPKGVAVTHANVARLYSASQGWFGFGPDDAWCLFHSSAFDLSVWEIWGTLAFGGRLVIVPYWVSRSPEAFLDLLESERVTVLTQTPSAFRQLAAAEEENPRRLTLRHIVFAGEALDPASLGPWFERHGDEVPRLVNMYGITETTVHVTYRAMTRADLGAGSLIGVPIPDLQTHVLDRHLQPVPLLIPGEIHVGGAGLARGYLHRPELTAQRFVPDPWSPQPGARLYRSGDLARRQLDGDLEYLGRIDHQVKIRGFRIELGEIQAALDAHPDVREAVVLARRRADDPTDTRLVAWVVARDGRATATGELRSWLEQRLPSYMIPAAFVALNALPLTVNGKVDRNALPDPDPGALRAEMAYAPPETPAEAALAQAWSEALGVPQVGALDNFFALGGDSILSLRVVTRARELGWSLTLQQIFQHQTVRELAREMVREQGSGPATTPFSLLRDEDRAHLPAGLEDAYPLARMQSGMLFHSELSPERAVYHDVYAVLLQAPFDVGLLGRAVRRAVAAHPVLRTSFDLTGFSEPLQLVHREVAVEIGVGDLRGLDLERRRAAATAWMAAEKNRPFDWEQAPLLRFRIHRWSDDAFQLGLGFHHAILDGWSLSLLLTELFRTYLALLRGEDPPALADTAASYRDFVALERQALASEESRRYWSERRARGTVTSLPRWPGAPGGGSRVHELALPRDLSEEIAGAARTANVPVKVALLAAHLRVLAAFTGQTAVVTGMVTNGRPETGGEEILGLFLNTVPFHLELPGGSWHDLLRQTFEAERELLAHRRFPVAELQRGAGASPPFEAAFNFVHFHIYQGLERQSEIRTLGQDFFEETSFTFLANFNQDPFNGQIHLRLEYDAGQFPPEQIVAVAGAYQRLLAALAVDPAARYELCSPLAEPERRQLLAPEEAGPRDARETPLHELFAAAATRDPRATAVTCDGRHLTYGDLAAQAGRLARRLRRLGVGPESRVGLFLERSPEMIAALLAVLQAGGAYVPLDPDLPAERLAFLLHDSGVRVLLTGSELAPRLPATPGLQRLLLDGTPAGPEDDPGPADAAETLVPTDPAQAAYVIYTSGSTGRPKGVVVTHANVARLLSATHHWFGFGPHDTWTLFHSCAFDFSVWEIWGALAFGGRLVVVPFWVSRSPEAFLDLLESERVTVLNQTPSAFRQLAAAEEASPRRLALRQVIFGGEALDPASLAPWFERHGDEVPRLVNMYGITETTVHVTYRPISRADLAAGSVLGVPIPDLQVRLLDRHLEPVPLLTPGEIHVGGAGLARGYLQRPELAAERFVPDPWSPRPGARLYRSGDLARRLPDGDLESLGRIDHQVKIRGFRIELGEIQAALAVHPDVREAVVLQRGRSADPAGMRLVAWVVARAGQTPAVSELRSHLERHLPSYMVPAAFIPIDALPLTINGKLDRDALPDPETVREPAGAGYAAPRDAAEEALATVWAEVLGVKRVGIHDNFFELGGDSILSIQITARARRRGLRVTPRQLFDHQTVAELAAVADIAGDGESPAGTAAEQGPVTGAVPLTPIQRWFFEQEQPAPHHFNHAVLLSTAALSPAVLRQVTALLLHHHDALRLRFRRGEDGWRQEGTAPAGEVPFTRLDHAALPEAAWREALESAAAALQASLDLAAGPLLRVASFGRGAGQPERLLLVVHHLVVDGVSWRILLDDLQAAYGRIARGEPAALPSKTTSFRQWAERLDRHARAEARQADLAWWTSPGHVRVRPLALPRAGAEEDAGTVESARTVASSLSAEETAALLSEVPRAYNTRINDALLATLALAYRRQTGEQALLVDLEGHGREEIDPDLDLSRTVGWFTTLYPVLLDLSGTRPEDPGGALRTVKETLRNLPSQGLGYGLLRYLADGETAAALRRLPRAEIAFNYLGQLDSVLPPGSALAAAGESSGPPRGPATQRTHALELNARVAGGRLSCDWTYSEGRHRRADVERLAAGFLAALRDLIAHCRAPEAGGYTPSDFPDLRLSQDELDDVLAEIQADFEES